MTVRKPTKTMTVPARLFTGEGHFVGETWMAGLRPTLAYFVPSLLISRLSFSCHVSLELVRIQMFGRGCTEADENRITCSELETGEGAGEGGGERGDSLLWNEARRK